MLETSNLISLPSAPSLCFAAVLDAIDQDGGGAMSLMARWGASATRALFSGAGFFIKDADVEIYILSSCEGFGANAGKWWS